jgi:2,4-dienoyl-CoA reductase-like NADH-dependent reductase (Old Yellow Enzyme family)
MSKAANLAASVDEPLFSPYRLGTLRLANRMVMAPMTRSRALSDGVPNPLARIYHAQRAAAGLIVSEATHASAQDGYFQTPGIYAAHRVAAWAKVVEAVHAAGGKIFVQLWHTGRTSHPDPCGGRLPPAPHPSPPPAMFACRLTCANRASSRERWRSKRLLASWQIQICLGATRDGSRSTHPIARRSIPARQMAISTIRRFGSETFIYLAASTLLQRLAT